MVGGFVTSRPSTARETLSSVPYLPGLDGLRALAVVAVMVYHASEDWLVGGFLGVEVFFVISGYLITLLLMAERERDGRINLGQFWLRRARRLLPALFVMLFLVLTYTALFRADALGKVRGDIVAGLTYVSNWYQIWVGQGYAAAGDFVPLRHLWSLAVEEQFYLLWPLVMWVLLRGRSTRALTRTARWLAAAAIGIAAVTALLYHGGRIDTCAATPEAYWQIGERCLAKADTLYLSTITRATGIFLGAAFAMLWRPVAIMRGPLRDRTSLLDSIGVAGLGILAALFWWTHFLTPAGADPWLFRGGLVVTDIATLMAVVAVTHRGTLMTRVLGTRPVLWVGTRSYGLYLYHWPIYQAIREVAGRPLTVTEFAVSMVLTAIITEISYTVVETPIRRRKFRPWLSRVLHRRDPRGRQVLAGVAVVSLLLLTFGVFRLVTADVQLNALERSLEEGAENTTSIEDLLGPAPGTTDAEVPTVTTSPSGDPAPTTAAETTTTSTTTTTTTTTLPKEPVDYLAFGDSVMLGAAGELKSRGYTVIAEQNRQLVDMIPVFEQFGEADLFGDPVIIHLGTNGSFSAADLNALLKPLSNVKNVVLVNVHANRSWTANNNALLAARDTPKDNIWLIDWNTLANSCPGQCFGPDGIHLTERGAKYYADMIGDVTGR